MIHARLSTTATEVFEARAERRAPWLLPIVAILPISAGLADAGARAALSIAIGITWLLSAPLAFYGRRSVRWLVPVSSAILCAASVILLPFNSRGFLVDVWTTLLVLLATIPGPNNAHSGVPVEWGSS
jgi:hypothetical protein